MFFARLLARTVPFALGLMSLFYPGTASAGELFGGVFAHDAHLPFDISGQEMGSADLNVGWRGDRLGFLKVVGSPSPFAYALINTAGKTSVVAAGIGWRFGKRIYFRPGIGLAVHTAPAGGRPDRIDFGSRVLFSPEASVGVELNRRLSIEATVLHFSHAQLFSRQNPGMDDVGVRLNLRL